MKERRSMKMAIVQAHGMGMKEKEKEFRDCLNNVSLALGVKTKGPHLNLGMVTRLGSPYWE